MIKKILHEDRWRYQLLRYGAIGSIVFVIDVGSFRALLEVSRYLAVAATLSYALAVCVHFTLNKYANFRKHDRRVREQASTYIVVAFICWCTTLAVVEGGVATGLSPLVSKIAAVALNIPIGFAGHRFLTFGPGIIAATRRLLQRAGVIAL
jgi:putative flippase GtrA